MFASLAGGVAGMGLGYACTLLQLHLGLGLAVGCISWAVGSNAQLQRQLAGVQWQAALQAWSAAARPALLLAVFALVQVRAEAMGFLTMVGLLVAAASVFLATLLMGLLPLCGAAAPEVCADTGDIVGKTLHSAGWRQVAKVLSILKACGQLPLLVAAVPGGAQLAIASGIARLALTAEVLHAFSTAFGFGESVLAEAAADVARALQIAPLLGGLVVMDHMAWGPASFLALPFQPCFYLAMGLFAQVALVLVLQFACGGGLKGGSAACSRLGQLNSLTSAGICLSTCACIWSIIAGTYEFSFSQSGLNIQWGEPGIATAIILAKLVFMTQVFEFFAPEAEAVQEAPTNGVTNHSEDQDEDEDGAVAAAPEPVQAQLVAPGVSEPMRAITSRAPGIILGLVAMQLSDANSSDDGFFDFILSTFSVPFRAGFPLCAVAMMLQVFLLLAFTAFHCEVVPVPEPVLDATGTLQWEPESQTGRKVVGGLRNIALVLITGGSFLGMLSLGLLPWILIKVVIFVVVFPVMPSKGKTNIAEAFSWAGFFLKTVLGAMGSHVEALLAKQRAIAEAAAAKKADLILAAEEAEAARGEKNTWNSQRKTSAMSEGSMKKAGSMNATSPPKKGGASKKKR